MNPALHRWRMRWRSCGLRPPNPAGVAPILPVPAGPPPAVVVEVAGTPGVAENTSPALPPVVPGPGSPLDGSGSGIETQRFSDNGMATSVS